MDPLESGLHVAGLTGLLAAPAAGGVDLAAGTRLGDVTIVRLLAEGGMGRVYEGLQGMPCRTVAVKVIRPGVLSPAAARRFEHEAHILGLLTHPGIARIYSLGLETIGGVRLPYFVMEFIEDARSITDYAAARGLSVRERVALFRDACRAVAYGHGKGVIHRDLKPGNILVDAAGQPKVIDFGVARSTDADVARTTMHTDLGQLVGTLQYMSPEQFDGSADDLDVRADVYALGLVLYELLAGRPAHDVARRPVHEVARVVREEDPAPLSLYDVRLRGDLTTIVGACLEKDRTRRYSSAAELEADLSRYLAGEPITASPPSLADSLRRLARRHRLAVTAAAGVAAALVAGVVGATIFAVQAERERRTAVVECERADAAVAEARAQLYVANQRSLQTALDARDLKAARQLHAANATLAGRPTPFELLLAGARLDDALVVLDLRPGSVDDIAFSPDGGLLAVKMYASQEIEWEREQGLALADHPLLRVNDRRFECAFFSVDDGLTCAAVGEPADGWADVWRAGHGRFAPGSVVGDVAPLAIGGSGSLLAVQAAEGSVKIVERQSGAERSTLAGHRGRTRRVVVSPDGSRAVVQTAKPGVGLWDTSTGRLVAQCTAGANAVAIVFSPDGRLFGVVSKRPDDTVELATFEAATGAAMAVVPFPQVRLERQTDRLTFSADGGRVAVWFDGRDATVVDATDGAVVCRLVGHEAPITAVAFSPDGRQIASGATNGQILLWDARTGAVEAERLGHDGAVRAIAFRADGATFASGSHDGTVRFWARGGDRPLAELPDVAGLAAVAFSPDGSLLATVAPGARRVELWGIPAAERVRTLEGFDGNVGELAFSPDGTLLAAACAAAASDEDGQVVAWRVRDTAAPTPFGRHEEGAVAVAFSPDGRRLLTTSSRATARVWDVTDGRELFEYVPRARRTTTIGGVFAAGGTRVVAEQSDILDSATGGIACELPPHGLETRLAASPDGRSVALATAAGSVVLYDVETGRKVTILAGHGLAVRDVAFTADGRRVATASLDATAQMWDAATGRVVAVCRGHGGTVEFVRPTPDGRRLLTSGADGTVRLWDAASGRELFSLPGQRAHPRAVAMNPAGTLVVVANDSGAVTIHGLSNAAIIAARQTARRPATAGPATRAAVPPAIPGTPPDRPGPDG